MYTPFKITCEKYILTPLLLFLSLVFSYYLADDVSMLVKNALSFCFTTIIGSVFPFLILTDIVFAFSNIESIPFFGRTFEKIFKINGAGIRAFIAGIICGFPLGVKVSGELYRCGAISREECERLICFSNNTGPAFVVFAIGSAMRKSLREGVILYVSMVLSSIFVGMLLGIGKRKSECSIATGKSEYDLVSSVKSAGINTLYICSYITFFSVVLGLLYKFLPYNIYLASVPFLEVGNAAKILSGINTSGFFSLLMTSFAVSFSGISVFLQAKSFLPMGISVKKYIPAKILQGCISAILTYIFII